MPVRAKTPYVAPMSGSDPRHFDGKKEGAPPRRKYQSNTIPVDSTPRQVIIPSSVVDPREYRPIGFTREGDPLVLPSTAHMSWADTIDYAPQSPLGLSVDSSQRLVALPSNLMHPPSPVNINSEISIPPPPLHGAQFNHMQHHYASTHAMHPTAFAQLTIPISELPAAIFPRDRVRPPGKETFLTIRDGRPCSTPAGRTILRPNPAMDDEASKAPAGVANEWREGYQLVNNEKCFSADGKPVQLSKLLRQYIRNCQMTGLKPHNSVIDKIKSVNGTTRAWDFSNLYVGHKGVLPLVDLLRFDDNIIFVSFRNCGLRNEAIDRLEKIIRGHTSLQYLDISHNDISEPSGQKMLVVLNVHPTLIAIKCDNTRLDPVTVSALMPNKLPLHLRILAGEKPAKPTAAKPKAVVAIASPKRALHERRGTFTLNDLSELTGLKLSLNPTSKEDTESTPKHEESGAQYWRSRGAPGVSGSLLPQMQTTQDSSNKRSTADSAAHLMANVLRSWKRNGQKAATFPPEKLDDHDFVIDWIKNELVSDNQDPAELLRQWNDTDNEDFAYIWENLTLVHLFIGRLVETGAIKTALSRSQELLARKNRLVKDRHLLYWRAYAKAKLEKATTCGDCPESYRYIDDLLSWMELSDANKQKLISFMGMLNRNIFEKDPSDVTSKEVLALLKLAVQIKRPLLDAIHAATIFAMTKHSQRDTEATAKKVARLSRQLDQNPESRELTAALRTATAELHDSKRAHKWYANHAHQVAHNATMFLEKAAAKISSLSADGIRLGDMMSFFSRGSVCMFVGIPVDPADHMGRPIFPDDEAMEKAVASKIAQAVSRSKATVGISCLRSGSEVLFCENMLARNTELHVVIPFSLETFLLVNGKSVNGDKWKVRIEKVLRSAQVHYASTEGDPADEKLMEWTRTMVWGLALKRANEFGFELPQAIVVIDSGHRSSKEYELMNDWQVKQIKVTPVDLKLLRPTVSIASPKQNTTSLEDGQKDATAAIEVMRSPVANLRHFKRVGMPEFKEKEKTGKKKAKASRRAGISANGLLGKPTPPPPVAADGGSELMVNLKAQNSRRDTLRRQSLAIIAVNQLSNQFARQVLLSQHAPGQILKLVGSQWHEEKGLNPSCYTIGIQAK